MAVPLISTARARVEGSSVATAQRRRLSVAYGCSAALLLVAVVAAAVGVFNPGIFRDPAETAGNARGTDLVILTVALPALVGSMLLTARGSARAQLVWLGVLAYIGYNAVFFTFDVGFNRLFPLYVATLAFTLWSTVALLREMDFASLRARFAEHTPHRVVAIYLLATTVLFGATWLRDIVPALVNGTTPASLDGTWMLTNPIQVVDFSAFFPATVLAAVWLWQRRPAGFVLGGAFLVYGVIEALSVTSDQWFGHRSDPSASAAMVPVFAALAVIALIPVLAFFRKLR